MQVVEGTYKALHNYLTQASAVFYFWTEETAKLVACIRRSTPTTHFSERTNSIVSFSCSTATSSFIILYNTDGSSIVAA